VVPDLPKPMVPVCGKPLLERQVSALVAQGYDQIILVVGYMHDRIQAHLGDGSRLGATIHYFVEKTPLGTAGALPLLRTKPEEDLLVVNGDIAFDIDLSRFEAFHRNCGRLATLFTHPNDHPGDSSALEINSRGIVTRWLGKNTSTGWRPNLANAGIHLLTGRMLSDLPKDHRPRDLDADLLAPLVAQGELAAYRSPEYVKDLGTPSRYAAVEKDWQRGIPASKNLSRKQRAVFLDRDGTLVFHRSFLRSAEQLELTPGASELVRRINRSGSLAILVTNQPVIARGEVTWEELRQIHNKLEALLGADGAYLDDIFLCPHHPDRGFSGERPEYKVDCDCRKPRPGLLLQAAARYNIDLSRSLMLGDSQTDIEAAAAVGCRAVQNTTDVAPAVSVVDRWLVGSAT
jgi:D-glycero-D-manno-heptose 1,7-bisphosphate phosphatase